MSDKSSSQGYTKVKQEKTDAKASLNKQSWKLWGLGSQYENVEQLLYYTLCPNKKWTP